METVAGLVVETVAGLAVETVTGLTGVEGTGLRLAVAHMSLRDRRDSVSSSVIWGK